MLSTLRIDKITKCDFCWQRVLRTEALPGDGDVHSSKDSSLNREPRLSVAAAVFRRLVTPTLGVAACPEQENLEARSESNTLDK